MEMICQSFIQELISRIQIPKPVRIFLEIWLSKLCCTQPRVQPRSALCARPPRAFVQLLAVKPAVGSRLAMPRLPCAAAVFAAALAAPTDGAITKDAVNHLPGLAAPLPSRLLAEARKGG